MADVTLTTEQQVRFTAAPTTSTGKPASLDGSLQAEVTSGVATVTPGATPLDVVVSSDQAGIVSGRVFGDADLGSGVITIEEAFTMTVSSPMASSLGISANVEPKA